MKTADIILLVFGSPYMLASAVVGLFVGMVLTVFRLFTLCYLLLGTPILMLVEHLDPKQYPRRRCLNAIQYTFSQIVEDWQDLTDKFRPY